jgi:hypothetical protein
MRRLTIGFALVCTLLLVASVAGAVPPGFCKPGAGHDDHPHCTTTTPPPPTSTTTTTTTEPPLQACPTETWTIGGNAQTSFDCLWTPEFDASATVATVTVSNIEGGIKKAPVVFVLDDFPGDICVLEQSWVAKPGQDYEVSVDLVYDEVPDGYEAWLGHSYWDFVYDDEAIPTDPIVGAYWCAPQDFVLDSLRLDTNGTSLHLRVVFEARKGGQLDITLSPGNSL